MADVEYTLGVKTDKQSIAQASGGLLDIDKSADKAARSVEALSKEAKSAGRELAKAGKGGAFDRDAKSAREAASEIERLARATQDYDDRRSQVSGQVGVLGDVDTSLATIGGGLDAAGLGGAGTGLRGVAEIAAVGEQLPLLAEGARELSGQAVKAASGVGGFVQGLVPATKGLNSAAVGVGALGLATAAVTIGVGLLASAYQKQREAAEEARQATIANAEAVFDAQDEVFNALASGNEQELANIRQTAIENDRLAQARAANINDEIAQIEQIENVFTDSLAGQILAARQDEAIALGEALNFEDAIRNATDLDDALLALGSPDELADLLAARAELVSTYGVEANNIDELKKVREEDREEASRAALAARAQLSSVDEALIELGVSLADIESGAISSNQALIEAAQARLQQSQQEQRLLGQSSAALEARVTAINNERAAVQGVVDTLTASGDTSSEVQSAIAAYEDQLSSLAQESEFITGVALDEVRAQEQATQARQDYIDTLLTEAQAAGQQAALQRDLLSDSTEGLQQRIDAINDERAAIEAELGVLQESGDTSADVTARIAELNAALGDLGNEAEFIQGTAFSVSAQREFQEESLSLRDDYYKTLSDIEQGFIDKSVSLAEKRVDDEAAALDKLNDALSSLDTDADRNAADDLRSLQREQLDTEIGFQRATLDAARDTARRIVDIRKRAAQDEEDALLSGDFAAVFRIRRDAAREIDSTQTEAGRANEDRGTELEREREDQARAFEQQRQDRQIAYDRAVQDAQANYETERQTALQNYQQSLVALQQKFTQEQDAARLAYEQELAARQQLYSDQLAQFNEFKPTFLQANADLFSEVVTLATDAVAEIQNLGAGGGGQAGDAQRGLFAVPGLASGGPLAGDAIAAVGERGIETFTSGGRTMTLPGAGLFQPFRGGFVNPNQSGRTSTVNINANTSVPQNITGNNPEAIARAVQQQMGAISSELLDRRIAAVLKEMNRG